MLRDLTVGENVIGDCEVIVQDLGHFKNVVCEKVSMPDANLRLLIGVPFDHSLSRHNVWILCDTHSLFLSKLY